MFSFIASQLYIARTDKKHRKKYNKIIKNNPKLNGILLLKCNILLKNI